MLDKSSKIYVAGHNGLVGSAIWNNLKQRGLMVEADIAKVASEGAAAKVRTNLAEYLEKGIVK